MTVVIRTSDLPLQLKQELLQSFLNYWRNAYKGWSEEKLGFPPTELESWLLSQYEKNVGEFFLVFENSASAFITFSETDTAINVYQMIGSEEQRIELIRALMKIHPQKPFFGAIRKANVSAIDNLLSGGCKIVENRFPQYSNQHYYGIDIGVESLISGYGKN